MQRGFYLKTCNTCQRIISEVQLPEAFEFQEIKTEQITSEQLEQMKKLAGSYEALFSKKARKYREKSLHQKELSEEEYRELILEEYTFLKRPVFISDDRIFIGNTKKTVEALKEYFTN